jgi:hypothetical protein
MKQMAMMRALKRPARLAKGGYALPQISDDSVVGAYGMAARSNPYDTQVDTNLPAPNVDAPNFQAPPAGAPAPSKWAGIGQKIGQVGESLAPFASNIANAFQKPPLPAIPTYDNSVTFNKPSFNNERSEVSREINGTNANMFRNLDANTAARVSLSNQGEKLNRLSAINEREKNLDTEIDNRQTTFNAGIQNHNNQLTNQYNDQLVERSIAQQRTQSENIANAGDKYVGIQNEKRKAQVDLDKTRTMADLFSASGVERRIRMRLKANGTKDPEGKDYKDLEGYKLGGIIAGPSPSKAFNRALRPKPNTSYRQLLTAKPQ